MDFSKGKNYMTSICYPLQACVKIKRYSPEMVWENGIYSSVVSAVCHSWTWHLSAVCVGWDIFNLSLCLHGFGKSICLSFDYQSCQHDLWSYLSQMLPNSRVMSSICSSENPSAVYKFHDPLFRSWLTLILPSLFRVDDVGFIMTLLRRIASRRLQLLIREVDLETPF